MSLILTSTSDVTFYTFDSGFDLHDWSDHDFSVRGKQIPRFGRHGAAEVGDRGIEPRVVTVRGEFHAANQAALDTFLDTLKKHLHHNGNLYRFSWKSGYYITVDHVQRFQGTRFSGGLAYRSIRVEIDFLCVDPFWYSTTADSVAATSIGTSPKNITFTNNGNVPSPLTIQCDPTATWDDFTIANATDGGEILRYRDPGFGSGDQLIINGQEGTVERDSLNTVRYFSGAFLRVLPGSNTITYTGDTGGTITLTAPKRYL